MKPEHHHPLLVDMTGKKVGALTVIKRFLDPNSKIASARWLCTCTCGKELVVRGSQLRAAERDGVNLCCSACRTREPVKRTCKRRRPKGQAPKLCPVCANLNHRVVGPHCKRCGRPFWPEDLPPVILRARSN